MGQSRAHLHIVERSLLVVRRQDGFALGRADEDLEPGVSLELGHVLRGGEACEDINIFCHHGCEGRGGVGNELEGRG